MSEVNPKGLGPHEESDGCDDRLDNDAVFAEIAAELGTDMLLAEASITVQEELGYDLKFVPTQETAELLSSLIDRHGVPASIGSVHIIVTAAMLKRYFEPGARWYAWNLQDGTCHQFDCNLALPTVSETERVHVPDEEGVRTYRHARFKSTPEAIEAADNFMYIQGCDWNVAVNTMFRRGGPIVKLVYDKHLVVVASPSGEVQEVCFDRNRVEHAAFMEKHGQAYEAFLDSLSGESPSEGN